MSARLNPQTSQNSSTHLNLQIGLPELVDQFEADVIRQCLDRHTDIDEEAARVLKISRSSLYGIRRPQYQLERSMIGFNAFD